MNILITSVILLFITMNCFGNESSIPKLFAEQPKLNSEYFVEFPQHQQFNKLEDFLKKMSSDGVFCKTVMQKIADLAEKNGLQHSGFYFESTKFSDDIDSTPLKIFLKKPDICDTSPSIHPLQAYVGSPAESMFGKYITMADNNMTSDSPFFKFNTHAVRFQSRSSNLLVIPRGKYVSLYDFSMRASQEELKDLWELVYQTSQEVKKGTLILPRGKNSFRIAAHTGSNAAQTVPHFHLRLETR